MISIDEEDLSHEMNDDDSDGNTKEMISRVQKDPRDNFPPYEFKMVWYGKKASGKEHITLIVNGCYKFTKRQCKQNRFYFECNFPKCKAKAIAIGEKNDKNPTITRIDTVHRLSSGDIHVATRGVRLAEDFRERLQQIVFVDPTRACRQVFIIALLYFLSR